MVWGNSSNARLLDTSEPVNAESVTVEKGSTISFTRDSLEYIEELHDVVIDDRGASVEQPPWVLAKVMWAPCTCTIFLSLAVKRSCAFHSLAKPKASPEQ